MATEASADGCNLATSGGVPPPAFETGAVFDFAAFTPATLAVVGCLVTVGVLEEGFLVTTLATAGA